MKGTIVRIFLYEWKMWRGMKIKENVRIYNNIVMTFWYEKQLKQPI